MHMQWTGLVREEGKNGYCWFLTYDEEGCLPHSCRSPERNPSFIVQRRIMHPFVLINSVRAFILEFSLHFPNQRCYSWDIGEMVFFFEGLLSILELSLSLRSASGMHDWYVNEWVSHLEEEKILWCICGQENSVIKRNLFFSFSMKPVSFLQVLANLLGVGQNQNFL